MSGAPQVSVVIPVHNGERYLAEAIESAIRQQGVSLEVLVVDDASTDGTAALARSYGDRCRHVALAKQATSIAVTNRGLELAAGTYVSILHHDDVLLPGKLRRHVEVMDRNPDVVLSYSAQRYIGPQGEPLATLRSPLRRGDYVVDGAAELHHLLVQNYINFCNALVRRSAYARCVPYHEPHWFSAEWVMWARLAAIGQVAYLDDVLVEYRVHAGGQTLAGTTDPVAFRRQLEEAAEAIYSLEALPAHMQSRRRLTDANLELSMAMLLLLRRRLRPAAHALARAIRLVRPWEIAGLVRSSALVPRTLPRMRLMASHAPRMRYRRQ